MTIQNNRYMTQEGVKVGDTLQTLKKAYPEVSTHDPDANNAEYERSNKER